MPIRNILVPLCPDILAEAQLEAALRLARPLEAHLNTVYVRPDPVTVLAALPSAVACRISLEELACTAEAAEAKAKSAFEAWRGRHRLATGPMQQLHGTYACWSSQVGPLDATIMRLGRLSDITVIRRPATDLAAADGMFDAAAFETGHPVLLAPASLPDRLLRHVVIAWNGSLEAARAVAGALPVLHAAETVSVFSAPWRDADLLGGERLAEPHNLPGYLLWHGIRARAIAVPTDERCVGAALLETAAEHGATLIVMGAYARSRLPQTLLGGVTAHVLRDATLPVLMAG